MLYRCSCDTSTGGSEEKYVYVSPLVKKKSDKKNSFKIKIANQTRKIANMHYPV